MLVVDLGKGESIYFQLRILEDRVRVCRMNYSLKILDFGVYLVGKICQVFRV